MAARISYRRAAVADHAYFELASLTMDSGALNQLVALANHQRAQIDNDLQRICDNADPLFRELALSRLAEIGDLARALSGGEIIFQNTETWRAAYERLLAELPFSTYYSAAWVRTSDYWRDQAGRRSLRLNYDLLDRGLRIERILILPEILWAQSAPMPSHSIRTWLEEQHYRGINLSLVRERDLDTERDLIRDFGIYGERACGEQELDEHCRTLCFRLSFAPCEIALAKERWRRLQVFAIPFERALDIL